MDLSLSLDHAVVAVHHSAVLHLLVELTAPPAPTDADRVPLRLAVVVDRSGSMAGGHLVTALRSTSWLARRLAPQDRIAVVAHDHEAWLVQSLAAVDGDELDRRLRRVAPGGTTDLSAGWLKGVEELDRADDGLRRVLLLSDGHTNRGETDPVRLRALAAGLAASGVSTTTIGVGAGSDQDLLGAVADAGRGSAHHVEQPDDAPAVVAAAYEDLAHVVARRVSVELAVGDDVEVVEVLDGHPVVPVDGGVQVEVGAALGGTALRVVARLRIPAIDVLGVAEVGQVTLRWTSVGGDAAEQHRATQRVVVDVVSAAAPAVAPDPRVRHEVGVLGGSRALVQAGDRAEHGDVDLTTEPVDAVLLDLTATASAAPDDGRSVDLRDRSAGPARSAHRVASNATTATQVHDGSQDLGRRRRR